MQIAHVTGIQRPEAACAMFPKLTAGRPRVNSKRARGKRERRAGAEEGLGDSSELELMDFN
jgi:hypothetical protein